MAKMILQFFETGCITFLCAISVPNIIKIGGNLTKLWQK